MPYAVKLTGSVKNEEATKTVLTITKKPLTTTADDLAAKYLIIQDEIKLLEQRKSELQEIIYAIMGNEKQIDTQFGSFIIQERRTLSWSLDSVRDVMGKTWPAFVKADDKILRARMATKDNIGCLLESTAKVALTNALTFKAL